MRRQQQHAPALGARARDHFGAHRRARSRQHFGLRRSQTNGNSSACRPASTIAAPARAGIIAAER